MQAQYSGNALRSFLLGLPSNRIQQVILQEHGLSTIEPEWWYDFDTARSIYYQARAIVGDSIMFKIGLNMFKTAQFPPELENVEDILLSLNAAYRLNCRGDDPRIGWIKTEIHDDSTAYITFHTPFPCRFQMGIITGCIEAMGIKGLVEHIAGDCIDQGQDECVYVISW